MAQNKNEEDAQDSPPRELVVDQNRHDNPLKHEQRLHFGPAWINLLVTLNANHHVDGHH